MRWCATLAGAVLFTLIASESAAQHSSTRLSVRASVVRSCTVQTGGSSATPAQVTCSRGGGPAAVTTVSPASTPATTGEPVVNQGAPLPVTETAIATPDVETVAAAPAIDDVTGSTEWPVEPGALAPTAAPRPAYQVVTINF